MRLLVCDACGGDGCFDVEVRDPGALYGCSSEHYRCADCDGRGHIEVCDAPMSMEDALMLDAEILRAQGVDVADPIFFALSPSEASAGKLDGEGAREEP